MVRFWRLYFIAAAFGGLAAAEPPLLSRTLASRRAGPPQDTYRISVDRISTIRPTRAELSLLGMRRPSPPLTDEADDSDDALRKSRRC